MVRGGALIVQGKGQRRGNEKPMNCKTKTTIEINIKIKYEGETL